MAKIDSLASGKKRCGIVMPISDSDGYETGHWDRVQDILVDALSVEFEVSLVSVADEVSVIHKTIVTRLAEDDLIVCDVSGKNPNVMFELGIRLTFDRPTVIVKDDATNYSFDTGIVEHLGYRHDLRFPETVDFKAALLKKCLATIKAAQKDPHYSPFIAHFGKYNVHRLPSTDVDSDEYVVAMIKDLQQEVSLLRKDVRITSTEKERFRGIPATRFVRLNVTPGFNELHIRRAISELTSEGWPVSATLKKRGTREWTVDVSFHGTPSTGSDADFADEFFDKLRIYRHDEGGKQSEAAA